MISSWGTSAVFPALLTPAGPTLLSKAAELVSEASKLQPESSAPESYILKKALKFASLDLTLRRDDFVKHSEPEAETSEILPEPSQQAEPPERWQDKTLQKLNQLVFWPLKEVVKITHPHKAEMGKVLQKWLLSQMDAHQAVVGVIARPGSPKNAKYDRTGMFHSGLVFYHPDRNQWLVHNLIYGQKMKDNEQAILEVSPEDFFSQQGSTNPNALVLLPDQATQKRLQEMILKTENRHLRFTHRYNLVSPPDGEGSLNCNKWVLLNILAAKQNRLSPQRLLSHISQEYKAGLIDVHPLIRPFAKQQPNIIGEEVPWLSPIYTVTVESLYRSELFEHKLFFKQPESIAETSGPSA